jgi:hypothetical protein
MHVDCTLHVGRVESSTATRMARTNGFFARQDHAEPHSTDQYLPIRNQRERFIPLFFPLQVNQTTLQSAQYWSSYATHISHADSSDITVHSGQSLSAGYLAANQSIGLRKDRKSRFRARDPRCMVRPFASVGLFVANQSESCWLLMFHSIHICSITCTYSITSE